MPDLIQDDPASVRSATACVVLAGGAGTRIGGAKPARLLAEETLLDHALRQAAVYSDLIAVSIRSPTDIGEFPVILDPPGMSGPLAGVAASLHFAREAGRGWVLTIPCDMPFLPENLLSRLATAGAGRKAVMAASTSGLQPVCCLWSVGALKMLPSFLAGEDRSLRGFAQRIGFSVVSWNEEPDPFLNVNCPADLDRARARLGSLS